MPNIKSAKKRVNVNKAKTEDNKALKSELKTILKKVDVAIDNNVADKAEVVKYATKKIDQAAAKGLMHKKNASRKKSQLSVKLNNANA